MAQLAEADPAQFELSIDGARPAAQGAAMLEPRAELRLAFGFFSFGFTGHAEPFCFGRRFATGAEDQAVAPSVRSGRPSSRSNTRASSSLPAVVTTVIFMPWT